MPVTGNATQKAPDPAWGRQLVGADAAHLEFYDRVVGKEVRKNEAALHVGLGSLFAGTFLIALPFGELWVLVGTFLFPVGLASALSGAWTLYRLSYAVHRLWGVYERGFVAPFYARGGYAAFVPWSAVARIRLRKLRADWADPVEGAYLFRAEEHKGSNAPIHRITESDLRAFFGYTPAEALALREEILAAVRACLPPERVVVEPLLADR